MTASQTKKSKSPAKPKLDAPKETKVDKPSLKEVEAEIVANVVAGKLGSEPADIRSYGDAVLATRGIRFYHAERWDKGRWCPDSTLARIQKAIKAAHGQDPETLS